MNNYCFICRKSFKISNKNFLDLFYFINRGILLNARINSLNINRNSRRYNYTGFRSTRLRRIRDSSPDLSDEIITEPVLEPVLESIQETRQETRQLSIREPNNIVNTPSNILEETIVDDIIDNSELREIEVDISNTLAERRRLDRVNRLRIQTSRYVIRNEILLIFSYFMVLSSMTFLLFSIFYKGKII